MNRLELFKVHPGLVDRHYTMNPKTEVLLTNGGAELEEDMVVLVAAAIHRANIIDMTEADIWKVPQILVTNRWCTVTGLEVTGDSVNFTAVYPDNTKSRRTYKRNVSWLAKRDPVLTPAVQLRNSEIPSEVFPREIDMNAFAEYYEPDGSRLENGMVVTLNDAVNRALSSRTLSAQVLNRWCRVTNVRHSEGHVLFDGVYADGSTVLRKYPTYTSWIVKRDSVVKQFNKREAILKLVQEAMEEQYSSTVLGSLQPEREMLTVAEQITQKIMDLG